MQKKLYVFDAEYRVCCGKEIPEGSQLCPVCQRLLFEPPQPNEPPLAEEKRKAQEDISSTLPRVFKRKKKK